MKFRGNKFYILFYVFYVFVLFIPAHIANCRFVRARELVQQTRMRDSSVSWNRLFCSAIYLDVIHFSYHCDFCCHVFQVPGMPEEKQNRASLVHKCVRVWKNLPVLSCLLGHSTRARGVALFVKMKNRLKKERENRWEHNSHLLSTYKPHRDRGLERGGGNPRRDMR